MAIVSFNKKIFEQEIGELDEKMQEKIAMFGTPLEDFNEEEIQIEVFPNRPDLLSYHGFKRSFLSFLGKKTGLKEYKINKPKKDYIVKIDSSLKDIRPFTACAIIKNLELDNEKIKEIIDIQEKLHITVGRKRKKVAIGIYPLEKIKLPIIYTAIEPDKIKFIPLDVTKEMSGLEILQKHPTGREYAHLLAGKAKFPIFIDAENNILSMPPIINSQLTGKITSETKDVFVECSGFDFKILKRCLNVIVTCLSDMGGKIYQMNLDFGFRKKEITPDLSPEKAKISLKNTTKLLGVNINEKEFKDLIEKMGYNYAKSTSTVLVPAWRVDILHEVDLIEDVAIAYGYNNFAPEIPEISTIGQENPKEIIKRRISDIITGLGILEVSNYHLTTKKDQFEKMRVSEKQEINFIELEESKTDYTILRKDLTHYFLKIFSENIDSEYPQKIFEIGCIFNLNKDVNEKENLAVAISPGNFTELKQILEYLFKMLEIKIDFEEPENQDLPSYFVDGRVASVNIEGKLIGYIGEIHPKTLKNWRIKMPVAILEIELEKVFGKLINNQN